MRRIRVVPFIETGDSPLDQLRLRRLYELVGSHRSTDAYDDQVVFRLHLLDGSTVALAVSAPVKPTPAFESALQLWQAGFM